MRSPRPINALVILLATVFVTSLYFCLKEIVKVDGTGQSVKSYSRVPMLSPKKEISINRHTIPQVKVDSNKPSEVKRRIKDNIRKFVQRYSPDDYSQKPYEVLVQLREKAINSTWSRNASRAQQFRWTYRGFHLNINPRKDMLAATGYKSARQFLYLTKENTQVGARLQFYQNGDSVQMSKELWNSLPDRTVFEPNGRFKRCSVVGTSGILIRSSCGEEIDEADFVFRFNLAEVKGYEIDVGTKTNFTTVNPSLLINRMHSLKGGENIALYDALQRQFQGSLLWIPAFSQPSFYKFVQKIAKVTAKSGIMKPVIQHPGHYSALMTLWRAVHRHKDWPSTGFYTVSSAFELCDEIDVFGFWLYDVSLEGAKVKYHYHNDVIYGTRHSRYKEFRDLVKLHEMGILKMHFGQCK